MTLHSFARLVLLLSVALAGALAREGPAAEVALHVSSRGSDQAAGNEAEPLATLSGAIGRLADIAKASPEADVRIVVHGGVFRIEEPLTIQPEHVPPRGSLTFAAAEGERPVVSGGMDITGWKINDDGSWSVSIPEAVQGKGSFRELFVGGQRRPRARHPNAGYVRIDKAFEDKRSGFTYNAGDLPASWTGGGELVFLHDWSTSRIPVKDVAHDTRRLTVAFPIGNRADHYKIDHFEPHPRYFVEGHRAFLDAPGEWLLDGGVLTYRPMPGERLDSTEVIAPRAKALLIVLGDDRAPIRSVHFDGLSFEHCAWTLPEQGYAGSQATAYEQRGGAPSGGRNFIPAAIRFEIAEDCSFKRGRIAHLGTSGIQFGSRTKRCRLEDSIIEDVSGNGVNLGEDSARPVNGRPWWQSAPEQAAAGHLVAHNRILHCGRQFFGAVAVWMGLARQAQITHNEIAYHPYTGVSLGWMWNPTPTPAGESLVARNHIHHVMQTLSDGGGIYTLGRQPGAKLMENVIHDVPLNAGRAESNGMFLDEGSDQMEIAENTIYGVDRSPLRFHRAQQMTVRANTLVVPTTDTPPIRYNNTRPETITQIDNRVVPQAEFDAASVKLPPTGPRK
jgi:hypothetical protein